MGYGGGPPVLARPVGRRAGGVGLRRRRCLSLSERGLACAPEARCGRTHRRPPGTANRSRPAPSPGPVSAHQEPRRPREPGFPFAAHALALEQGGDTGQAKDEVGCDIAGAHDGEMTLTHQWLPDLVRLRGRPPATVDGPAAAGKLARLRPSQSPGRLGPSQPASGRLGRSTSDPEPLRDAVAHYREVGPAVDLPDRPGGSGCCPGRAQLRRGFQSRTE